MAPPFLGQDALLQALITLLVASAVVYFAARMVIDRSSFLASIATVLLGTLLAGFLDALLPGWIGTAAAAAGWALVAAAFFRTEWLKGAVIGLVAWVLWWLVGLVVDALS